MLTMLPLLTLLRVLTLFTLDTVDTVDTRQGLHCSPISRASLLTIELSLSPSNIVSGGGLQVVGFKGFLGKGPGVH